jgi:D-hexose-6-phosphate mutarotase
MSVERLNATFGLGATLKFSATPTGLIVAEIENPLASAKLCLQGAQLLSWRPRSSSIPVVWLSEAAQLLPGKSPHSGAPVCWPWFGAHASDSSFPAHGFARNLPWEVTSTSTEPNGATRIALTLPTAAFPKAQWPHATPVELVIVIGDTLQMSLTTTNLGETPVSISEAFHTYFQVGDISQTQVSGLDATTYADKVLDFARNIQQGVITFDGEVDRVYLNTPATCTIVDPVLRRRIHITKSGSLSTVVWTPGQIKGDKLGDLGQDGWRRMVCVESANTMENSVSIPPQGTHTLTVTYAVEQNS